MLLMVGRWPPRAVLRIVAIEPGRPKLGLKFVREHVTGLHITRWLHPCKHFQVVSEIRSRESFIGGFARLARRPPIQAPHADKFRVYFSNCFRGQYRRTTSSDIKKK